MNAILRILKMPWLAMVRTPQRWLLLVVWFFLAVDVSRALPIHGAILQFGLALLMLAVATAWKMASNTLWLARDARALRLPRMERDADNTLVLCAIATVLLPALILGATFGETVLWLVSLALVAMATLAFCMVPVAIALPAFAAVVVLVLFGGWHPPLPGDPAFLAWAVPALIMLTVASLQRWIALRRAPSLETSGWLRPTTLGGRMVQLRRLHGGAVSSPAFDAGARPRKAAPGGNARLGPAFPVRSIRTALSAGLAPYDLRMGLLRWRRWQAGLAALGVLAVIAALVFRSAFAPQPVLTMIAVVMIVPTSLRTATDAWREGTTGLPLLALLPRLGSAARVRRDAVAACMAPSSGAKLWFAAAAAVVMAVLHWPAVAFVYLALMLVCGLLLELAIVTNVVGGRPLPTWTGYAMYGSAIMVPLLAMQLLVPQPHAQTWLATRGWQIAICMGLWLAWCAGFALLALRGWRALQHRPHPFLANLSD